VNGAPKLRLFFGHIGMALPADPLGLAGSGWAASGPGGA